MGATPTYLGRWSDSYSPGDLQMTYTDYLQHRQFHDHMVIALSDERRALITAADRIGNAQIARLEAIEAGQSEAAAAIVMSVSALENATRDGFDRVGSMLDWGFSQLILEAKQSNELLEQIAHAVQQPTRTWAEEWYRHAVDQQRQDLYEEALQSVEWAINGHGSNTGFATDHRYHFLLGIIRLGSPRNHSPRVVDPAQAEEAFFTAARYARRDFPSEAAKALMCAARAAYVQGQFDRAVRHAEEGLQFANFAGLRYELARALLKVDRVADAEQHLQWAIRLDKWLLLKAEGDPGLTRPSGFRERVFKRLLEELRFIAAAVARALEEESAHLSSSTYMSRSTGSRFTLKTLCPGVVLELASARKALEQALSGGSLDLRKSLETLPSTFGALAGAGAAFLERLDDELERTASERAGSFDRQIAEGAKRHDDFERGKNHAVMACAGAIGFIALVEMFQQLSRDSGFATIFTMLYGIVAVPFAAGVTYFVASIVASLFSSNWPRDLKEMRERRGAALAAIAQERREILGRRLYQPLHQLRALLPDWLLRDTIT